MNIFEKLWFRAKTGANIEIANGGKPIEQVTIECRGYYLFVDFDVDSGEPTGDFGWSEDPTMNPTVPVKDILFADRRER